MDAPKGRYSVLERDGRLVVVDNQTGEPATTAPAPRPAGSPAVVAPTPSTIERAAALAVRFAASGWDEQGRAVIGWEWQENGRTKRWDARLDAAGQRRLGRALLSLVAAPVVLLLGILPFGFGAFWLALLLAASLAIRGYVGLRRLHGETSGTG